MVLYSDTFISFFLVKISKQGVSFYSKSGNNVDSVRRVTAWLRAYEDLSSLLYLAIFLHYLSCQNPNLTSRQGWI